MPVLIARKPPPPFAPDNALHALAHDMTTGEWLEYTECTNLDAVFGAGFNSARNRIIQGNTAGWDPINRRIHYAGGDHLQQPIPYSILDLDSDTAIDGASPDETYSHGADENAVDPATGDAYFHQHNTQTVYECVAGTWSALTNISGSELVNKTFQGLTWWSGAMTDAGDEGVLCLYNASIANGKLYRWDKASRTWLTPWTNVSPGSPAGGYVPVCEYSPQHNCLVLGGGVSSSTINHNVYRVDANGTVTDLGACPSTAVEGEVMYLAQLHGSNFVPNPRNGNIIIFGRGELWELDPTGSGTWTDLTATYPPPMATVISSTVINGMLDPHQPERRAVISCAITEYGVILYLCAYLTHVVAYLFKPPA